jgi:hypothetical protein
LLIPVEIEIIVALSHLGLIQGLLNLQASKIQVFSLVYGKYPGWGGIKFDHIATVQ